MTTPPKRWPKNAEDARLDGIAKARRARRELAQVGERVDDVIVLRSLNRVCETLREIEAGLIAARGEREEGEVAQ